MARLASKRHEESSPEERSAAASLAAKARHSKMTAAEKKALGRRLAEARAAKRAGRAAESRPVKKRASPKTGKVRRQK
jgi:hypothetical protein